jgi:hypothetical protein
MFRNRHDEMVQHTKHGTANRLRALPVSVRPQLAFFKG